MKEVTLKTYNLRISVQETIKTDCVYYFTIPSDNLKNAKIKAKELAYRCRSRDGILVNSLAEYLPEDECEYIGGGSSISRVKSKSVITKSE